MPSMMKAPHSRGMDCPMCEGGACKYAEGGDVFNPAGLDSSKPEKGVHHTHTRFDKLDKGQSRAGSFVQHGLDNDAKNVHRAKLAELRAMKGADRTNLAEGGEIGNAHAEPDMDAELDAGLGKELLHAFEAKDGKAVMSAIEACVLHCISKGDGDMDEGAPDV